MGERRNVEGDGGRQCEGIQVFVFVLSFSFQPPPSHHLHPSPLSFLPYTFLVSLPQKMKTKNVMAIELALSFSIHLSVLCDFPCSLATSTSFLRHEFIFFGLRFCLPCPNFAVQNF